MSKLTFVLALVALMLCALASAEVIKATEKTFDDVLSKNKVVLVKFYAPWCGHCKTLAPEFIKASEALKDKAALVEVDCTVEKALAEKYEIKGFPTLILFKDGVKSEDYDGGRTSADLIGYIRAMDSPLFAPVKSQKDLDDLIATGLGVALVKTASEESPGKEKSAAFATKLRKSFIFAITTDASVLPDSPMESITVFVNREVKKYDGDIAAANFEDSFTKFLNFAKVPLFGEVNPTTFSNYMDLVEMQFPIGYLFTPVRSNAEAKAVEEIAPKYRSRIVFASVDSTLYGGFGQQLALPKDTKIGFVIDWKKEHYILPLDKPINTASLSEFVENVLEKKTKPTLKTQAVPEKPLKDGLLTLVGSTLQKEVDLGKPMFVLFFAEWCGHCKKLHPEFEKLAKELEKEDVTIAKIDATENDIDGSKYEVNGFPTLLFILKDSVTPYEGPRTMDGMKNFVVSQIPASNTKASSSGDDHGDL